MLRHIYAIASDSKTGSSDINKLNPVDSLFGFVGPGENNALAGRLSFSFGLFDHPNLSWFKVPYFYGHQHFSGGNWVENPEGKAKKNLIDETWRIFPHVPFAPGIEKVQEFDPDDPTFAYFRAVMPGSKARFNHPFLEPENRRTRTTCLVCKVGIRARSQNGQSKVSGFWKHPSHSRSTVLPDRLE